MTKVLSIFLSLYIFTGTVILPKGDFGFITQIPSLYDKFVQVNGSATFDEFLDEELLDPLSPAEEADDPSEPYEKECHPVAIDLIAVTASTTFYTITSGDGISQPEPTSTVYIISYIENYTSTDLDHLYHPPETSS